MVFILNFAQNSFIQIFVFGSFFMGVYYFSFYNDGEFLRKEIEAVKVNIQTAQQNIDKTKIKIDNILVFKSEVETKQEIVKALINYTPESITFNEVSTIITNEALVSGVNIESKRDGSVDDIPDTNYQTLNVEIELLSSFSQLMGFLSKLTQQKRILIVQTIEIKIDQDKDFVLTRIQLLAYRYQEPEENPEENPEEV